MCTPNSVRGYRQCIEQWLFQISAAAPKPKSDYNEAAVRSLACDWARPGMLSGVAFLLFQSIRELVVAQRNYYGGFSVNAAQAYCRSLMQHAPSHF